MLHETSGESIQYQSGEELYGSNVGGEIVLVIGKIIQRWQSMESVAQFQKP
jgi:hypothetical protein